MSPATVGSPCDASYAVLPGHASKCLRLSGRDISKSLALSRYPSSQALRLRRSGKCSPAAQQVCLSPGPPRGISCVIAFGTHCQSISTSPTALPIGIRKLTSCDNLVFQRGFERCFGIHIIIGQCNKHQIISLSIPIKSGSGCK